ncbi:MBL fold metallo-hydrolase [Rhodanobacter sp. AS-Z3]|uniref:MBL fold metallo-hydrolase RNA specificity domain-containing protein n=1 Tax=Rhodanobacter sp. AS-Z3 TaxID=3031330 RepID=UPI00247844A7|nr:MBL fold metallo-hydrolase [Rhodanobacter sp. AS-Z3]WEN14507.1 MBL fold metallo-hydrolase [Rhodanobacter sp. AS-Z3]
MIIYSCHGGAKQVTGSCHLITCNDRKVLIDCGMFQGSDEVERGNAEPFGFDPAGIDVVLLTHAHLDHCGRIPLLVRQGFRGRIIATAATRELARIVMLDSAGIQEEDARRAQRKNRRAEPVKLPLYSMDDALHALDFFAADVSYDETIPIVDGIRARFLDAGHILGSASILLDIDDGTQQRSMLFSGDLGNPGRPILRDPTPAPAADYVVMESTYGDRPHRSVPDSVDEMYQAIRDTVTRRGNVVIPSFALERTQEILYYLHRGLRTGAIPQHVRIFLDSPMAISATEIFRRHPECFDVNFQQELQHGDPFAMPGLHFTRETAESMAINNVDGGAIILAGSGMCNGGRIRHHLKHNLWRERSSVVFVGYAAEGTLARRIVDGAASVRIFNEDIPVRAQVWTINGFSAHADQPSLLAWLGEQPRRKVFLVHGEYDRGMHALQEVLEQRGFHCQLPGPHEPIKID